MHIDASCHCGHVTFEAEIDPERIHICHCTDCQTLTGSPFRVTAFAAAADLRFTGAAPRLYIKHGDNGAQRRQYFCPDCGSPLLTAGEDDALWGIRWGAIRQRAELTPSFQIWCASRAGWLDGVTLLPGRDRD